jgi:hypothetical protein
MLEHREAGGRRDFGFCSAAPRAWQTCFVFLLSSVRASVNAIRFKGTFGRRRVQTAARSVPYMPFVVVPAYAIFNFIRTGLSQGW